MAWGATVRRLGEANHAKDPAAARVEAIKTGLSIGAGTVGVFALLLAVRRQWHQELNAAAIEHDASERRATELYTRAVEQLGSDKAAVRLGGLYALERVAQNNSDQRQTVVIVLCVYLRMRSPHLAPRPAVWVSAGQHGPRMHTTQHRQR